ncbi:hypothetical protein PHMEG_00034100 [Phytophthora megakarya]|uniref:Uncharacterized protein n=1 Tax=Phytophthora megakarya TaxID=4795 RepID=A0A225URU5_9STRA|nr:hypothetical protein PHMEG_00034100 [Phytophthora megakarya]
MAERFGTGSVGPAPEASSWHIILPVDEQLYVISDFIIDSAQNSSTIKVTLLGVCHFFAASGYNFPASHPHIRMLIKGQKTPVSIALLERCTNSLDFDDPADQALWGFCAWLFFLLCRSEIAVTTKTIFCWFDLNAVDVEPPTHWDLRSTSQTQQQPPSAFGFRNEDKPRRNTGHEYATAIGTPSRVLREHMPPCLRKLPPPSTLTQMGNRDASPPREFPGRLGALPEKLAKIRHDTAHTRPGRSSSAAGVRPIQALHAGVPGIGDQRGIKVVSGEGNT